MKKNNCIMLSAIILLLFGSCKNQTTPFKIPKGHVGMFGYGSLMSEEFIESGLLDKTYDGPFLSSHLEGYKRSWTFAWPSNLPTVNADGSYSKDYILVEGDTIYPSYLHYLNIREEPNSIINGVLYVVPEADLPAYDSWEAGYERFDVTHLIKGHSIEGGTVFAYKALPDFMVEPNDDVRHNIIESSYVEILEDAFAYWGKEFEAEFRKSTEPVNKSIIRKNQKILWENPPLEKVEELKSTFEY